MSKQSNAIANGVTFVVLVVLLTLALLGLGITVITIYSPAVESKAELYP